MADRCATLSLNYSTERQRKEHVRFTLSADVQPIVTLPGEDEVLSLDLSSSDVGEPIDDEPRSATCGGGRIFRPNAACAAWNIWSRWPALTC